MDCFYHCYPTSSYVVLYFGFYICIVLFKFCCVLILASHYNALFLFFYTFILNFDILYAVCFNIVMPGLICLYSCYLVMFYVARVNAVIFFRSCYMVCFVAGFVVLLYVLL